MKEQMSDRNFTALMKKSKLDMPFEDFDENVISRMQKERSHKQKLSLDVKLSFFFFLLGTFAGLLVNFHLQQSHIRFFGMPPQSILLVFQAVFVLLFLTQLEGFIKSFIKSKT